MAWYQPWRLRHCFLPWKYCGMLPAMETTPAVRHCDITCHWDMLPAMETTPAIRHCDITCHWDMQHVTYNRQFGMLHDQETICNISPGYSYTITIVANTTVQFFSPLCFDISPLCTDMNQRLTTGEEFPSYDQNKKSLPSHKDIFYLSWHFGHDRHLSSLMNFVSINRSVIRDSEQDASNNQHIQKWWYLISVRHEYITTKLWQCYNSISSC